MPKDPDSGLVVRRQSLGALLQAYSQILSAVEMLHEHGVAHFDLKADNFLCDPPDSDAPDSLPEGGIGGAEKGEGGLSKGALPQLVVADFGVATLSRSGNDLRTPRDRGTECIKSPEMIMIAATPAKVPTSDGPAVGGDGSALGGFSGSSAAARACDVWSLGCLFYELVVGTHLYGGEEWGSFYVRLTGESMDLIPPAKLARLPPTHATAMSRFLGVILQRRPEKRPTVQELRRLFDRLVATVSNNSVGNSEGGATTGREAMGDDGNVEVGASGGESVPLAPSPRGALGVADSNDAFAPATASAGPSAASLSTTPAAAAAWVALSPSGALARLQSGLVGSLFGVVSLTEDVVLAPRRALCSASLLHGLRVGQIVCCGVQPPARGAHGGIGCMVLPAPCEDPTVAARSVNKLADRVAATARTTLLVGDESAGGCVEVATALLQLREGISKFDAAMRVSQLSRT
jgi:hypothetical protein